MSARHRGVLALALAGAGCAGSMPFDRPRVAPPAVEVEDAAVTLDEPPAAGARRLGLADVVELALAHSLDLALARAEEQLRKARAQAAAGRLLPWIEAGAGLHGRRGRVQGSFGDLRDGLRYHTLDPGLALVFRANPGAVAASAAAARYELEAATLERLDVEQRLLLRVTQLYYGLVFTKIQRQVASELEKGAGAFLALLEAKQKAGLTPAAATARPGASDRAAATGSEARRAGSEARRAGSEARRAVCSPAAGARCRSRQRWMMRVAPGRTTSVRVDEPRSAVAPR